MESVACIFWVALFLVAQSAFAIEEQLELWNTVGRSMSANNFPFREGCDKNLLHSPYRLSLRNVTAQPFGSTVCYSFHLSRVDSQFGCATGDLHQLEIEAVRSCKQAVANVIVNGKKAHYAWEAPSRKPTAIFRVTNLGLGQVTAPHATLCFDLRAPCGTLDMFCAAGGAFCQYSIFNSPKTCCSTGISTSNGQQAAIAAAPENDKKRSSWCSWWQ